MNPEESCTIYYNSECGTCRQTLEILLKKSLNITKINYLESPLNEIEIENLLTLLKVEPKEIIRTKEKIFNELNIDLSNKKSVVQAIAKYPVLLVRPIIVYRGKAVIGRPAERVNELL